MARTNQRLPKYSFHNGDMLVVKVTNIESPHLFYTMKVFEAFPKPTSAETFVRSKIKTYYILAGRY